MQPLVSVVIPCLNCAGFLPHAVSCTLSQTYENIECIIVDDGATDNSREVAEALIKKDSRIRYVKNTDKHGLSGVRNFGLKHAKGEWIQFYDVDDHLYPEKIKLQLNFLTENNIDTEQDMVLYSDFEVKWENENGDIERSITNTIGPQNREQLLNRIMSWHEGPTMPLHVNSTLFKRRIFENKLFNEDMIGFEEIELFTDLLYKKIKFIYIPTLAMSYRIHGSNVTNDQKRFIIGYFQFLEEAYKKDPDLVKPASTRINIVINTIMKKYDRNMFNQLITIIKKTSIPFCYKWKKISIRSPILLKLIYFRKQPLQLIKSIILKQ